MDEPAVRVSKLIGAQVNDISGNQAGHIQDIIVNPRSGRIDFALLSLKGSTANGSGSLVPVPWKLLRPSSTAQYSDASSQPVFTLNVDQSKLSSAPTLSSTDLGQSQWRQRVYSYYGVTPQPTDSEQEGTKGQGARSLQGQSPGLPTAPQPPPNP
jgi:sporulation protein YlmC with PRC-barrel domain